MPPYLTLLASRFYPVGSQSMLSTVDCSSYDCVASLLGTTSCLTLLHSMKKRDARSLRAFVFLLIPMARKKSI